jgi:hypothetical protein
MNFTIECQCGCPGETGDAPVLMSVTGASLVAWRKTLRTGNLEVTCTECGCTYRVVVRAVVVEGQRVTVQPCGGRVTMVPGKDG